MLGKSTVSIGSHFLYCTKTAGSTGSNGFVSMLQTHLVIFAKGHYYRLVIVSNKAECFQELQLARKMRLCSRLIVCFLLKWEPDDGMKTGNDYRKLGGKMPGHKAKGSSRDKWPRAQDDVFIRINKLTNNKVDDGGYFSKQPTVGTKKHYHY